ncbi:hypothetical protein YC2023_096986 [Brassica napus]
MAFAKAPRLSKDDIFGNREENTKVTRKVLADLSNLGGNTLRPTLSGNNTV